MSDQDQENRPSELQLLKERADLMKIKYHVNIGVDKLRIKVNGALNPEGAVEETPKVEEEVATPTPKAAKNEVPKKSIKQLKLEMQIRQRKEANRLVRVVVMNMNPNKKDYPGEIFTVSNSIVGTIKKYVPFNVEAGYHIPAMILKQLQQRRYQSWVKKKLPGGGTKVEGKLVPEFAIQILDKLTPEDLKKLAIKQALNHSIDQQV